MGADPSVGAGSLSRDDEGLEQSGAVPSRPERSDETVLGPGAIVGGKYEVLRVLGHGGMGMVLAARHLELGQTVAIKVMHAELAADTDSVKRFMREGRAAALLRSDHAVRIHDVGRLNSGLPFLVMEHLIGEDLDHLRARGTLEVSEVVDYILQAIAAIAEAHESGLVHRDIKPQNLFLAKLPDGTARVKVLDFGLAKDLAAVSTGSGALTTEHMILGSPHFMSPEQIRSPAEVDARADVWALGATMVQLLTGQPPYTANNVHGLLARILADPAPKVRALRPDVPVAIEKIIERCMEKNLARRYGSVIELATALQLAVGWVPSGSRGRSAAGPAPTPASGVPSTAIDPLEVSAVAPPATPRMAPQAITRASPHAAPLPGTPHVEQVTLQLPAPPASAPATTMAAYTMPTPTLPLGDDRSPPTARAQVAMLTSLAPPADEPSPPRRIPRAWLAAFFLITISATAVAGLALRESHRRRDPHVDPKPTIVGVAPPVTATEPPPLVTPPAPPVDPPAKPSATPSTPPVTAPPPVAMPKRPKPSAPPTAAPCPSSDPYCWGK